MQTRSSSKLISESSSNPISTNSKHHNRRRSKPRVKPFSIPIVMMADNRTMEEMLQAPTDAIVVPDILAKTFEIRTGLLSLIQANQFHDIYGEELTLRIDDEARTFNVGQTLIYSYIDAELINRIDVIDVACEEYVQDVLGFFDNSKSGSPTPTSDHIISYSSRSFTPFEGSDFILEEIDTFLQTPDELSILDDDYYDTEGDILCLEKLLNEDPFPNLPLVKTKDLKQVDATMTKFSID
nr:reverse transcriptase domain-containing protein [Tanacetum cinerariifolium]